MRKIMQGGAIAFKTVDGSLSILLVRTKKAPQEWIFPKGHIEEGETAAAAAARELMEEAGVQGQLIDLVGSLEFQSGDEAVCVAYYLFRFLRNGPQKAEREIKWCNYDQALILLSHSDAAELLAKALPIIQRHMAS